MAKNEKPKDANPVEGQGTLSWKKHFEMAWNQVKKVSASGLAKSEKVSAYAKHQTRRSLLYRDRQKLFKELGELTFHLWEDGKINHTDLERSLERIQKTNEKIKEETDFLENLNFTTQTNPEEESPERNEN